MKMNENIRVRGLVPRTAYLIPGRGGKWGGRCRDVRRRFRFRRRRRFRLRSSGWVAAGVVRPTRRPASRPAGWLAVRHLPCPKKNLRFRKPRIFKKKQ